ncbi:MAG: 50S ribosomal protein L21e [Candidatus Altiarchaeota archaeon]|nr:50S ribosomal protein L21e [Candidatus Altiarchaeota archaeon]
MAFKAKGPRARSRHKLRKKVRGMPKVNSMLKSFEIGDKVAIVIEPSVHTGMPYHRFHGRVGSVEKKRGASYLVRVKDGGKTKLLISHPVHLKKVMG